MSAPREMTLPELHAETVRQLDLASHATREVRWMLQAASGEWVRVEVHATREGDAVALVPNPLLASRFTHADAVALADGGIGGTDLTFTVVAEREALVAWHVTLAGLFFWDRAHERQDVPPA